MQPFQLAGIRFMLAGLLLLPFCGQPRLTIKSIRSHWRTVLLVALFQTFILYGLFHFGMTLVEGAFAAIIIGANPLFSAVAAHVLLHGDRLSRTKGAGITLGILGVVLITLSRKPWIVSRLSEFWGVLILIGCNISSALGNVVVSKSRDKSGMSSLTLTAGQLFIGGLGLLILSLFVEGRPELNQPLSFYGGLVWLSFISAAGFSIWFILLRRPGVKVSRLNVWKFLIPVCGACLAWIVLPAESPDWMSLLGMLSVTVAIWVFNRPVGA